ncbi:MAG: hypothetical protein LUC85_05355 [Bacteroidales bacterium]|nr:hypothetical protein [Bacteroidales bacterium]MCD8394247.1 hypothetical protein [Bacteroidales bacterium]
MATILDNIGKYYELVNIPLCVKLHKMYNDTKLHKLSALDFSNFLNGRQPLYPIVIAGRNKFSVGYMLRLLKDYVISAEARNIWLTRTAELCGLTVEYVNKHCYLGAINDQLEDTQNFLQEVKTVIVEMRNL